MHLRHKVELGFVAKLLFLLIIVAGSAAAVLLYEWNLRLTAATPDVRFIKWSDQTLYNSIDLPYNLYADMWTYDSNASYGIKNTHATASKTTYIYIYSINDTSKVYNVTVEVRSLLGTTLYAQATWQGGSLPTTKQSFNAVNNTAYTLRVWIKGASSVAAVLVTMRLEVRDE